MASLLNNADKQNGAATSLCKSVRRQACYLTSQGQPLFAWLHETGEATTGKHGVLICQPWGHEQIHSHRALRHLADALAAAGMLACRFDYHGTGDSAGSDEDPDRVATWLANIRDAIEWMKAEQGCSQISVVGLRLGALLALQAVAEKPVSNLVLWAPVTTGKSYVREMQVLHSIGDNRVPGTEEAGDLEAAGFLMTRQTADDLKKCLGTECQPNCQRALIVARDDLSQDQRLIDHLSQLGIDTQQIQPPGYVEMMAEPHLTEVPRQAITDIVNWLASASIETTSPNDGYKRQVLSPTEVAIPGQPIRERVLTIPGQPNLVGHLIEPADKTTDDLPLVVLLNAGAAYRVGPNRLYVLLSRQLAAEGFRSLRVDLAGLGDSVAADHDPENDSYSATMFRDIDLVLRHAQTHLGAQRVVLLGLCSGAYGAFQAAAQFTNPALIESVLINPLAFFWKEGMSINSPEHKELAAFRYYATVALQPAKWWKLISGRTRVGIYDIIKILTKRWSNRSQRNGTSCASCHKHDRDREVGHPQRDDLSFDLKRAVGSGRHLSFFFSADDPGYGILMYRSWGVVKVLRRSGAVTINFIQNADHTFSRRQSRKSIVESIVNHLRANHKNLN